MSDRQKQLKEFLARRHPDYCAKIDHWLFLDATYEGGRDWFKNGNIFRYLKEGDGEFNDRIERAYRFNHTREVTDLVQKYIFKSPIIRQEEDAPAEIKAFWENSTLAKLDVNQFFKLVSTESSKFGRAYVVVDNTAKAETTSLADAKANGDRVYSYIVTPPDVLDMGFSEDGELMWMLIREKVRDDADPILSSGAMSEQFRLWTKDFYQVFTLEEVKKRGKTETVVVEGPQVPHKCKQVPVFPVDHVIGENQYSAPALINDIAYLDRAVANYLSNLDAIIQDQTFSQLAMPAQGILPGQEAYDALIEAGTKRTFIYDGEGGAKPDFISPDPRQAQMIITVINKIIAEIYHTIGMAGERTKDDNAAGIDNSSGVAKAYDFERMNSLLTSKADSLENAENRLVELVLAWHGKPAPEKELVKYPDTFDVRSLFDEFTIAEKLALVQAPDTLRQEQMKQIVDKLFPRLAAELKTKLEADIGSWPPKVDPLAPTGAGAPPTKFPAASKAKPAASNRQGQVTKATVK